MSKLRFVAASVLALTFMACKDTLVVEDQTDPDRDRALGKPADVEAFIGSTYAQIQDGTLGGSNDDVQTQLQVMGMENTSALANFAMGPRGSIPRTPIENTRNSTGAGGNYRDFVVMHRAARMAVMGLAAIQRLVTLGSPAQDARARAFARFVQGVAFGNLALVYDSASIVSETDVYPYVVPFSSYTAVMAAAYTELDSAITIARATPGSFPLPAAWINGNALDTTAFFRLIHSYKARFRADVGRTPAERAAADWAAIIADANAGITADFTISMNPTAGWDVVWPAQAFATGTANWHQMSQFWMGMADSSGGYDAWLTLAPALRGPFLVVTRDLRFPQGTARAAQNGDTLRAGYRTFAGSPYWRNRPPGEDQPGQPLQISMYDFYKTRAFQTAGRIGNYPIMTRAEMRLLSAEGYLRTGNFTEAINRINVSRRQTVSNTTIQTGVDTLGRPVYGPVPILDSIPNSIADTLTPIPGGAHCVPRIPDVAAAYKASKCGNVWDALKWEYRMETAYSGYGMWYFAARGWGDLPEGTAMYWPVPYQEMDARRQTFYSAGGVGGTGSSPHGNYGLFAGGVY
jgi:hypothetical protein